MFATAHGTVRRNSMAAFTNIPTAGKIAMRFGEVPEEVETTTTATSRSDPTDRLIGVSLLTEDDDVLLATRHGKAIRFMATDVREFQSRTSTGVRGIRLQRRRRGHLHVDPPPRRHHARRSARPISASRRGRARRKANAALAAERIAELAEKEQFILTVTENGYGKRSSAYEYRRTNRGGQGITNIDTSERNGCVVASFPAHQGEALMLVTDQAKMIRTTVGDIRIDGPQHAGRHHLPGRRRRACRQRRQDRGERRGRDRARGRRGDRAGRRRGRRRKRARQARRSGAGGVRSEAARRCDEPPQPARPVRVLLRTEYQEESSMPLPHNALVLVADGRKMLFFRNHGDENQIDLRTEAHDEREDRKDSEIKTDAPGDDQAKRRLWPLDLRGDRLPPAGGRPLDQGCGRRAEGARPAQRLRRARHRRPAQGARRPQEMPPQGSREAPRSAPSTRK